MLPLALGALPRCLQSEADFNTMTVVHLQISDKALGVAGNGLLWLIFPEDICPDLYGLSWWGICGCVGVPEGCVGGKAAEAWQAAGVVALEDQGLIDTHALSIPELVACIRREGVSLHMQDWVWWLDLHLSAR